MIAIATRFYEQTDPKRIQVLLDFIKGARKCAEHVLVAVNKEADITNALEVVNEELRMPGVKAFPVTPWNHPTGALNSLVFEAEKLYAKVILFASAEIELTPEIVTELNSEMAWNTLVVGAVMKGHNYIPFSREPIQGNGYTVPWNTCALWNLKYLSSVGFPLVTNAPFDPIGHAGSEELVTIALYKKLFPGVKAILKKTTEEVKWNTANFNLERSQSHANKISNKAIKSVVQLGKFDGKLSLPTITHARDKAF